MAIKKFMIQQTVTLNNEKKYCGVIVEMDEADLPNFLGTLEGGYTVMVEDASHTDTSKSDTNNTDVNFVRSLSLSGKDDAGHVAFASIKPYRGSLMFKRSMTNKQVADAIGEAKAFPIAPTVKVSYVKFNDGERLTVSDGGE